MPTDWIPAGNPVSYLETLAQRQAYMEKLRAGFNDRAETLAHDLYTTKINYDTWQRYMRQEIKAMHTAALIIARGGDPKAITKADWAACQKAVRDQYAYLRNFALQAQARAYLVETGQGDFFSEKYMATRSKLYGGACSAEFYRAFAYGLLPTWPRSGDQQCKTNCKCELEFTQGNEPEVIEVRWALKPAEHCGDCVRLSQEWNPYLLRVPEGLSASEWVTWLPRMRAGDLAILASFNQSQPRDEEGKWTHGPGGGASLGGSVDHVGPGAPMPHETSESGNIILYHGTDEATADHIAQNGWSTMRRKGGIAQGAPSEERSLTFLSPKKTSAKYFAESNVLNKNPVVVRTELTGKILDVGGAKSVYDAAKHLNVKYDTGEGYDYDDFRAKLKRAGYVAVSYKDKSAGSRWAVAVFDQSALQSVQVLSATDVTGRDDLWEQALAFARGWWGPEKGGTHVGDATNGDHPA